MGYLIAPLEIAHYAAYMKVRRFTAFVSGDKRVTPDYIVMQLIQGTVLLPKSKYFLVILVYLLFYIYKYLHKNRILY